MSLTCPVTSIEYRLSDLEDFFCRFNKKYYLCIVKQIINIKSIYTMDQLQIIQSKIYDVRGVKVMLDKDLAELYQVTTGNLNKAVKRNNSRFPSDFMFQLTKEEWDSLRFQFGILESGRGKYTKYLPHAFTEQGLAMLSGVLNSKIAINVNISIMRAFVALRKLPPLVRKDDLLIIGDLIHGQDIQFKHPEICATYDHDENASIDTRKQILKYQ